MNKLDQKEITSRFEKAKEIRQEALEEMSKYLVFTIKQYADNDIVNADALEEHIVRNLMFRFANKK